MRKRSTYRPRPVRLDVLGYVVEGLQPMAGMSEATTLRIVNHAALAALSQGVGTRLDVNALVEALNMTEALACQAVGTEYAGEIRTGQDALLALAQRGLAAGDVYVFRAAELTAVNLAMEIHDAQLDAITLQQLDRALELVRRKLRSGAARVIAKALAPTKALA